MVPILLCQYGLHFCLEDDPPSIEACLTFFRIEKWQKMGITNCCFLSFILTHNRNFLKSRIYLSTTRGTTFIRVVIFHKLDRISPKILIATFVNLIYILLNFETFVNSETDDLLPFWNHDFRRGGEARKIYTEMAISETSKTGKRHDKKVAKQDTFSGQEL